MATKSQLPMIRSLKAIARRKMNEWPDVPPAIAEQIKKNVEKYDELLAKGRSQYIRRAPVSLLRSLVMRMHRIPLTDGQKYSVAEFDADLKQMAERINVGHLHAHSWQQQEAARYREIFQDLENTELQVIAGESVDLAPYTRQLKG